MSGVSWNTFGIVVAHPKRFEAWMSGVSWNTFGEVFAGSVVFHVTLHELARSESRQQGQLPS
ncbi:hypothetical protein C4D60_Mb01t32610 [Musa balbisiana]|uniref:Uncharacterized protein n=1 Tax=Musa balbisiana TaxID=52838 RepID=A0A4S8JSC3_MUSBA|nr:hypothetical protein C4D60_Mb01t32610 [Musa balbisiana]